MVLDLHPAGAVDGPAHFSTDVPTEARNVVVLEIDRRKRNEPAASVRVDPSTWKSESRGPVVTSVTVAPRRGLPTVVSFPLRTALSVAFSYLPRSVNRCGTGIVARNSNMAPGSGSDVATASGVTNARQT
jgi:hypothetical protein